MSPPQTPAARRTSDRWWWLWRILCAAGLVRLAACAWLARPSPGWHPHVLGCWTGSDSIRNPDSLLTDPVLSPGAGIADAQDNSALRFTLRTEATLGRLPLRLSAVTMASWIQTPSPIEAQPRAVQLLQWIEADRTRVLVGFTNGHPSVELQTRAQSGAWTTRTVLTHPSRVEEGTWMHLACSSDGELLRLTINGRNGSEARHSHTPLGSGRIRVGLIPIEDIDKPFPPPPQGSVGSCLQDDLVVFDRVLTERELAEISSMPYATPPLPGSISPSNPRRCPPVHPSQRRGYSRSSTMAGASIQPAIPPPRVTGS